MENSTIVEKYLIERGLNEPKIAPTKELVLKDEELLQKIANINPEALKALIQGRIDEAREELVMRAVPAEVFVQRQIMIELAQVLEDHDIYIAENDRRTKAKDTIRTEQPIQATKIEDSSANVSSV